MRKQANRILCMVLAIYMLLPLSNIYINLHRCGGTLVSIGLFTKAKVCKQGVEEHLFQNTSHFVDFLNEKSCCSEESIFKTLNLVKDNSKSLVTTDMSFTLKREYDKALSSLNIGKERIRRDFSPWEYLRPENLQVFII